MISYKSRIVYLSHVLMYVYRNRRGRYIITAINGGAVRRERLLRPGRLPLALLFCSSATTCMGRSTCRPNLPHWRRSGQRRSVTSQVAEGEIWISGVWRARRHPSETVGWGTFRRNTKCYDTQRIHNFVSSYDRGSSCRLNNDRWRFFFVDVAVIVSSIRPWLVFVENVRRGYTTH